MNAGAMEPFGRALLAYSEGDTAAELLIRRDDGQESLVPVGLFFRGPSDFSAIEQAALDLCRGHVLDIGAGTGLHSLALQGKNLNVSAIDISPHAVSLMKQRGLVDVHCTDVFDFRGGRFDTLLMLGHGIGLVETIAGLDRFLAHAHHLLREDGQLLLDSLDVRLTRDPGNLAYQQAARQARRHFGEIRMQFEFQGEAGDFCGWLHVDPGTLARRAERAGWRCRTVLDQETGDHLAQLTTAKNADRWRTVSRPDVLVRPRNRPGPEAD
jgi:SAM-dependent methyltransferase